MGKRTKRFWAVLLSTTLVIGLMSNVVKPITANAEASESTTKTIASLGTTAIETEETWAGNYVYFGTYGGSAVKYRVLGNSGGAMFLDCDSIIAERPFDTASNIWSESALRDWLNGTGETASGNFYEESFTSAEQMAIKLTELDEREEYKITNKTTGDPFTFQDGDSQDKIFLLSAYEADTLYASNEELVKTSVSSVRAYYLRSVCTEYGGYSYNGIGMVNIDLGMDFDIEGTYFNGVSPALNVDTSRVLFSSVVSENDSDNDSDNGTSYKLTLLDDTLSIATNGDVTRQEDSITVPYSISDESLQASVSDKNLQASVLILDKEYTEGNTKGADVLYYAALDSKGTFTLPEKLSEKVWGKDYYAYIVAENILGETYSDYASTPVAISISCLHAGETEIKDKKDATCKEEGYTGDTYCKDCGDLVTKGTVIAKLEHTWDEGVVTKEATPAENGEKTYTCTVCQTTKTEEIPALGAPEVGKVDTDDTGKAKYQITKSDLENGTVTYQAPTDKKKSTVTIPATVVIDGVTYKVTSIAKNAFKNNKYIKKVTIGSNVKSIGNNAFYNCKNLKSVKLGKNVTTIGDKAFYKCVKLTSITIPSKVTKIGKSAFEKCKKLKNVTIKTKGLKSSKIGKKAFKGIKPNATIKVPKKKYKAYKEVLLKRGVSKKAKFKKI